MPNPREIYKHQRAKWDSTPRTGEWQHAGRDSSINSTMQKCMPDPHVGISAYPKQMAGDPKDHSSHHVHRYSFSSAPPTPPYGTDDFQMEIGSVGGQPAESRGNASIFGETFSSERRR